jgi:hypothetical protein
MQNSINQLRQITGVADSGKIPPAAGSDSGIDRGMRRPSPRSVLRPEKRSSRGEKCRQPDAEVENEPDHARLITYDYGNFCEGLLISYLSMAFVDVFVARAMFSASPGAGGYTLM